MRKIGMTTVIAALVLAIAAVGATAALKPVAFVGKYTGTATTQQNDNAVAINAYVPLGEMFGYATDVRSSTQGRASFTMQFDRYEEVPANIAESIIESRSPEPVGAGA